MTPRTLFIIILRVLGILSLKELFISIPQLIVYVLSFFGDFSAYDGLFMFVFSLLAVGVNMAVSYYLIFKADFLVTKLGLEQGIQETSLQLNISVTSILRIALIITAFLILFFEIPDFLRIITTKLQQSNMSYLDSAPIDWSATIISSAKIIIGFLLIGERKRILEFLETPAKPEEIK